MGNLVAIKWSSGYSDNESKELSKFCRFFNHAFLIIFLFGAETGLTQGLQINPVSIWPTIQNLSPMPWEYFNDVDRYENAVYLATEHHGIQVFSKQPFIPVGNPDINVDQAINLTVSGRHLLAAAGLDGLVVYDLNEPFNPERVASYTMDGFAKKVASNDRYIAVLMESFTDQVLVFDAWDPSQLSLVETLDVGHTGIDLALAGSKVLVCNLEQLLIFDMHGADPTNPTSYRPEPGENGNPRQTMSVTVHESKVFLVTAERVPKQLIILDISDPSEVKTLSTTALGVRASRRPFGIWDSKILFQNGNAPVLVVDFANPTTPVLSMREFTFDTYSAPVLDDSGILYLGRSSGVEVYQLGTGPDLDPMGELLGVFGGNHDLEFLGDRYIVSAAGLGGLRVFDISNPEHPILAALPVPLDRANDVRQVETWGNIAAVLNNEGRLRLLDLTNPLEPIRLPTPDPFLNVLAVTFEGSQLVVYFKNGALCLYEVHSNGNIQKLRDLQHPDHASRTLVGPGVIRLVQNKLLIADNSGVWILDLAQANPTVQAVQIQPFTGRVGDVSYRDGKCFLLSQSELQVFDAATGELLQTLVVHSGARNITLDRNLLFVSGQSLDVYSLDDLQLQGSMSVRGPTRKCLVRGDLIHATGDVAGLIVAKMSAANPAYSLNNRVPWRVHDFGFRGETGFLKSQSDGALFLIDHSSNGNPSVLTRVGTETSRGGFSVSDDGQSVAVSTLSGSIILLRRNTGNRLVTAGTLQRDWGVDEVAWIGTYLILAGQDRLEVLDPNGGQNMVVGSLAISNMTTFCRDLILKDGKAYLSYYRDGLLVVDLSNPTNPVIENHFKEIPEVRQLIPFGNRLLALCNNEIMVLETLPDHSLQVLGRADGYYRDGIVLNDRFAYLVSGHVDVWDLQDPLHPRKIGANHGVVDGWVIGLDGLGKITVMGMNVWYQLERFDQRPRLNYRKPAGFNRAEIWIESPLNGEVVIESSNDLSRWFPLLRLEATGGVPTPTGLILGDPDHLFFRVVKP